MNSRRDIKLLRISLSKVKCGWKLNSIIWSDGETDLNLKCLSS